MYQDKKRNGIIMVVTIIVGLVFFFLIRHHAGAILMCEKASIKNPEIKALCKSIISSQQAEVDQMKAKLSELEK